MADKEATNAIGTLLENLFTGGPGDAVIAVLTLVVAALGFVCWMLYKRLTESETERIKNADNFASKVSDLNQLNNDLVKQYNNALSVQHTEYLGTLKTMNSSYQTFVHSTLKENADAASDITEALSSVHLTLAELKTLVSIISMRGVGNGNS